MIRSRLTRLRQFAAVAAVVATATAALSACAASERSEGGGGTGGTLTFGAAGAPSLFDPFYATDGETFRISRQIFDGLVGIEPGTSNLQPALATDWRSSEDGLSWTFDLQEGVTFHDGTEFDAEAVCANFERMFNQTGAGQSDALSYYWIQNFGGFADGAAPSLYESCTAQNPTTAVIRLTRVTGQFPALLALESFSMQSPTAMERYQANGVRAQGEGFVFSEYATSHPTGTGPFRFVGYDEANGTVELARYGEYRGEPAKLDRLIFRVIPDETARRQALEAGEIDGYDFPSPADWQGLRDGGFTLQIRDPFNILYLGISQKDNPALRDLRVRQALAHAIDRETLVASALPDGAEVATQFYPQTVDGWAQDVQKYPHDPQRARQLLAGAGQPNLTIDMYWPTEVTRPYMPDPQSIFGAIREDLEAVGITVNPVSRPWAGGYTDTTEVGDAPVFLLGWTGDYNSPHNFVGTFFSGTVGMFHTGQSPWGQELSARLQAADSEADEATRIGMYQDISRSLMADYLPAIPLSHSPPAVVTSENVEGLVPSPLTKEEFAAVSISE